MPISSELQAPSCDHVVVSCRQCGYKERARVRLGGAVVSCLGCGARVRIPGSPPRLSRRPRRSVPPPVDRPLQRRCRACATKLTRNCVYCQICGARQTLLPKSLTSRGLFNTLLTGWTFAALSAAAILFVVGLVQGRI